MNILSFDCANRSLAVCLITVPNNDPHNIAGTANTRDIKNRSAEIHTADVFDLTGGRCVDTVERTRLLKDCLTAVDEKNKYFGFHVDKVLVEYQMPANDKSRCVSQQIVYHYSGNVDVSLVGPSLKNKVCFSQDDSLSHGAFMERYASKYTANKNHTKANFLHWLDMYDQVDVIEGIKKQNVDDIADAFMQVWGWLDTI